MSIRGIDLSPAGSNCTSNATDAQPGVQLHPALPCPALPVSLPGLGRALTLLGVQALLLYRVTRLLIHILPITGMNPSGSVINDNIRLVFCGKALVQPYGYFNTKCSPTSL